MSNAEQAGDEATDEVIRRAKQQEERRARRDVAEINRLNGALEARHGMDKDEERDIREELALLQGRVDRALERLDRTGASVTAAILRGEQQ